MSRPTDSHEVRGVPPRERSRDEQADEASGEPPPPRGELDLARVPASPIDTVYRQLFLDSDAGQFIAEPRSGRLVAVNDAFVTLCGYTRQELIAAGFEGLDRLFAHVEGAARPCTEAQRRPMTLVRKDHGVVPVQLTVTIRGATAGADPAGDQPIDSGSADDSIMLPQMWAFGSVTDVTRMQKLESALNETRESARTQFEVTMRVMQITNRIMALPRLLEFIEAFDEPRFLFEGVCDFLSAPEGMEYAAAAIFWRSQHDDGVLRLEHQSDESDYPADLPLHEENPLCAVARGEIPMYQDDDGNIVVPVTVNGKPQGCLSVQYHDVTRRFIDNDKVTKDTLFDVVVTVTRVLGTRLENIQLLQQIRQQTITDPLTRVYNRRFFDERLKDEFIRSRRYKRPLSLIMIDLDKFKHVNDSLGHQQGDSVLIEFAEICRNTSRKQDLICRMGGDEFAMILPDTPHWAAAVKAEKLRKKIERHTFKNIVAGSTEPVEIGLSVGVAGAQDDMESHDAFYSEADEVLYASKENGRNRVTVARPELARREAAEAQRRKEQEQREAAEAEERAVAAAHDAAADETASGALKRRRKD